jgi:hypothetical protein
MTSSKCASKNVGATASYSARDSSSNFSFSPFNIRTRAANEEICFRKYSRRNCSNSSFDDSELFASIALSSAASAPIASSDLFSFSAWVFQSAGP